MVIDEQIDEKIENQISFDFLNAPATVTQVENHAWVAEDTLVILLRSTNKTFQNIQLCGKTMLEWVKLATSMCQQKVADEPEEDKFLDSIKSLADQHEFVAVFYDDTPLFKKETFLSVMDYFSKQHMNVLRLSRGWVFRGEYLKNTLMLLSGVIEDFDKQAFLQVDDAEKFALAYDVLQARILDYHKKNGVVFFGASHVDADVEIEAGAVIFAGNTLKGESFVGRCAVLESGNYIENAIICENAHVIGSFVRNSKVEAGAEAIFEKIINETVVE